MMSDVNVTVVVPNWNAESALRNCLKSLDASLTNEIVVVVDNASTDGSVDLVNSEYPGVSLIKNEKNLGFAGGINRGICHALIMGCEYVALLNNDAMVDKNWLKILLEKIRSDKTIGVVTGRLLNQKGKLIDSTGEAYTSWGLPYPRGRNEKDSGKYGKGEYVFGASGGASLYRVSMLKEIGLFDEDFFAYYEDVDLSFRAQLAGWKVAYEPKAIVYHATGSTSNRIPGFTTYQTLKNLPWVYWKNVPSPLFYKMFPRIFIAYWSFFFSALARGAVMPALKGAFMAHMLMPKKLFQRIKIQRNRKVSVAYIDSMLVHDLPPNAHRLRKLRAVYWKLRGKHS